MLPAVSRWSIPLSGPRCKPEARASLSVRTVWPQRRWKRVESELEEISRSHPASGFNHTHRRVSTSGLGQEIYKMSLEQLKSSRKQEGAQQHDNNNAREWGCARRTQEPTQNTSQWPTLKQFEPQNKAWLDYNPKYKINIESLLILKKKKMFAWIKNK